MKNHRVKLDGYLIAYLFSISSASLSFAWASNWGKDVSFLFIRILRPAFNQRPTGNCAIVPFTLLWTVITSQSQSASASLGSLQISISSIDDKGSQVSAWKMSVCPGCGLSIPTDISSTWIPVKNKIIYQSQLFFIARFYQYCQKPSSVNWPMLQMAWHRQSLYKSSSLRLLLPHNSYSPSFTGTFIKLITALITWINASHVIIKKNWYTLASYCCVQCLKFSSEHFL